MSNDLKISRVTPLRRLISFRPSSSLLLILATIIAIILANSPLQESYFSILEMPVKVQIGDFNLFDSHGGPMSLAEFANDVLMVLFFLHVGLGIRQELLVGELSSPKKALFPVVAACGGMIFPILLYLTVCHSEPGIHGMAIPMATDIAFSLAVLTAIPGVPAPLKVFLATLAVADDIGGILVIAVFYSHGINLAMLGIAILVLLAMYLLGRSGARYLWIYYLGMLVVWYFFFRSGIHTTVSGVLVAMIVPAKSLYTTGEMVDIVRSRLLLFSNADQRSTKGGVTMLPNHQLIITQSISKISTEAVSPVQHMEWQLGSFVNYIILPVFAFVNGGIAFGGFDWADFTGVPLAILLGLFVGKPMGIYLFSRMYLFFTRSKMPEWMNRSELLGLGIICGIGFTVSLFISTLSFDNIPSILNEAKTGIFLGSLLSGIVGYLYLTFHYRRRAKRLAKRA